MISITVFHNDRHMNYQSNIVPNVGDIYASHNLFDEHSYTVTERLISAKAQAIAIRVKYTHPELVPKPLTEAERDLLTQEFSFSKKEATTK